MAQPVPADPGASGSTEDLVLALGDAAQLAELRVALGRWLAAAPDVDPDSVVLAVHEAAANAVRHGRGGTTVTASRDGRAGVRVVVESAGPWQGPPQTPEHGRGLPLMERLADVCTVDTGDARVRVELAWHARGPA